jgi:peroxiredoxin
MRRALILLAVLPLCGQAKYMATSRSERSCPRVEENEENALRTKEGGYRSELPKANTLGANPIKATTGTLDSATGPGVVEGRSVTGFIPKGSRKDAGAFAVLDADGKKTSVASAKGKVVVINFWQTACEPSASQLMEMADYQAKGEKFGFLAWPVNYDEQRWVKVKPFLDKNRKFFEKTKVYVPGLGAEGPAVLMNLIPELPALFIIDREGRLAYQSTGYEANTLGQALQRILVEK